MKPAHILSRLPLPLSSSLAPLSVIIPLKTPVIPPNPAKPREFPSSPAMSGPPGVPALGLHNIRVPTPALAFRLTTLRGGM